MDKARILIVEDEALIAEHLRRSLLGMDYEVLDICTSGEKGVQAAIKLHPDVVLMDIRLAGTMDGTEAAMLIRDQCDNIPVIYLSAHGDETTLQQVKVTEPTGYLLKPVQDRELRTTIETALYRHQQEQRLRESEQHLELRTRQQTAVSIISQKALANIPIQALMDGTVAIVAQVLEVDLCNILELLHGGEKLRLRAGIGWEEGLVGKAIVGTGKNSQAGYTLHSKEPVIVSNLNEETRFSGQALLHDHSVISGISVVIGDPENPFGVLGVHTKTQRNFTQDNIIFLQSIANVLATAMERKRTEEALRESEQRFRTLVESIDDIVYTLDRQGRNVEVFGRLVERFGLTPETFIGKTAGEILSPEAALIHEEANARALEGQNVTFEWSIPGSEGTLYFQTSLSPIRDSKGSITGIVGLGRDITQQKQIEGELRRSEERFRRYYELGLIGMTICSPEGIWIEVNDRLCEMLGYSREELLDKHWREFTHPDDLEVSKVNFERALAGEIEGYIIDKRFIHKDGGVVYTILSTRCLRREDGSADYFVVLIQDITQRVQAEDALRIQRNLAVALSTTNEMEQALDHLLEATLQIGGLESGGIYLVDPFTGDLELLTHRGLPHRFVEQVSHIDADTSLGHLVAEGEPVYQHYDKLFPGTKDQSRASEGLRALAIIPIKYEGQAIAALHLAYHSRDEIPPRARALLETIATQAGEAIVRVRIQAERESLLAQVREIMNTVPEGVLLLDTEGRVILANPVALHVLQDLAGISVGDILTQLGDWGLSELLTPPPSGLWHEVKSEKRTLEVITRPMESSQDPARYVMVMRDVTQEREIQQSIQQQERLAAVGQLAAGIAHDFNNILAVILLYTEIMLGASNIETRQRDRLVTISQQAKRASELIQQILDFSRRAVLERLSMDLLPFLKEQNRLLERTLPENIQIKLSHQPGEYMVNADPVRLQQAVMNLALNARDAMPEGGELNLTLARSEPDEDIHCVTCGHIVEGEWMHITISDTGSGIPEEALPHIFEPFFTTKGPGQGTGLGLAQVYGIIKQHEGHLNVLSRPGRGSAFNLYLPALPTTRGHSLDLEVGSLVMGQGQTILLVEDEPVTQKAMLDGLSLLNYRVISTANGREALELLEQQGEGIDLVLSDVVMPEMGGIALFQALRERGLSIPVILMTGHPMQEELEDLRSEGLPAWLLKPPRLKQLAEIIAHILISG